MISTLELLKEMARLTALSGRVSDVQLKNLQFFPLVFFEGITEVKIEYDLMPQKSIDDEPTKSNSLISYHLTLDELKNSNLEERFLALEKSVRTLFWSDTVLEIYFNKKIVYKSTRS